MIPFQTYMFCYLRPRLHGTGRIWNRTEIRPFRSCVYPRTLEPDEFVTRKKVGLVFNLTGFKLIRYRVNTRKKGLKLIRYRVNRRKASATISWATVSWLTRHINLEMPTAGANIFFGAIGDIHLENISFLVSEVNQD